MMTDPITTLAGEGRKRIDSPEQTGPTAEINPQNWAI